VSTTLDDFRGFLEARREEYARNLRNRVSRIEGLGRRIAAGESQDRGTLEREAHTIAGSGAVFGFAAVGDAARALENAAPRAAAKDIASAVAKLRRALESE
jgi:HPt (histidine-containing phosphotransfer) domain-containing protein